MRRLVPETSFATLDLFVAPPLLLYVSATYGEALGDADDDEDNDEVMVGQYDADPRWSQRLCWFESNGPGWFMAYRHGYSALPPGLSVDPEFARAAVADDARWADLLRASARVRARS